MLREAADKTNGARIFAYAVNDPERYGVVEFDDQGSALSLEEKPRSPNPVTRSPGFTSTISKWSVSPSR